MIDKFLFWNIGSFNTQKSFERLIDLNRSHHYKYIALMEPFQDPSDLELYRRNLGLKHATINTSTKIWIFWDEEVEGQVIGDASQRITMRFTKRNKSVLISAIYARCSALDRLELWEDMENIAEGHTNIRL